MDALSSYDADFYEEQADLSIYSASVIVPIIYEIVKPERVVDFGCGVGGWLAQFKSCGAVDILGLEGGQVPKSKLRIDQSCFRAADFRQPINVGHFDLACSLEVAEHLPPGASEQFVASLCRAAPVVLFSAAVPYQGGVDHVNERWLSDWCAIFANHNYVPVDVVRPRIWGITEIPYWYRQNLLLFMHRDSLQNFGLREDFFITDIIHPEIWRRRMEMLEKKIAPPSSIKEALSYVRFAFTVIGRRLKDRITGVRGA
ncbi:methyltransferase domain-containing protein [Erythrobacter sp. sf7]|uniref:Methyltransferase domain-containing protein n=1 Tax=Erythrobacter fulvus TaxID=2987523 RepID=A0ABT5JMI2_9SPHN|nr:methyltransferase domain-containing protein [Erythrobacter fulvus]MDC8753600.1 methyltransferase domain-containing protein [Erythrobacter fulvus]